MYKTLGSRLLFDIVCPASAFATADRDEARNPQRFIHVTVSGKVKKRNTYRMTYREKLQLEDWKLFRTYIMQRDNYSCQQCGKLGYDESVLISEIHKPNGTVVKLKEPILIPTNPVQEFLRLNVHHKCYRKGCEPWEYSEEELITLCPECHKKLHEKTEIPVLDEKGRIITSLSQCDRCNGFGFIPEYHHIEAGICFKCWGEGVLIDKLDKL